MKNLTDELVQFLHGFERIKMISPENRAPHIVTFSVRKIKGEVIINALQKEMSLSLLVVLVLLDKQKQATC